MSGVYQEVWSSRICNRCLAAGRGEHHLRYVVNDEDEMSALQIRCVECKSVETRASAVGNDLRKRLLKAEKRARSRVFALVVLGTLLAGGAFALAASALAALK